MQYRTVSLEMPRIEECLKMTLHATTVVTVLKSKFVFRHQRVCVKSMSERRNVCQPRQQIHMQLSVRYQGTAM